MNEEQTSLLLIEDNQSDALLITLLLQREAGDKFSIEHASNLSTGIEYIGKAPVDLVLLDLALPDSFGKETFQTVYSHAPDIPIIVLTGFDGDELGLELVSEGAQDYLAKGQIEGGVLVRSIRFAVQRQKMLKAQQQHLEQFRARETRMRDMMEQILDGILVVDIGGKIHFANSAAGALFGRSREQLQGERFEFPIDLETATEIEILREDSSTIHARMQVIQSGWEGEAHYVVSLKDITERIFLEEKAHYAYGLENIGKLASGIAHDLNNVLTVIMSYSSMGSSQVADSDKPGKYFGGINRAAKHAEALTQQLLTFSKRQIIQAKVFDLNELILEIDIILQRLTGSNISLFVSPAQDLKLINVDSNQLEQVIINLVVNARDAMPNGGSLTIETANALPEEVHRFTVSRPNAPEFIKLVVRDTGLGMDEATSSRVFEPFFTTKGQIHGTGLGLSTCRGIVSQFGGEIKVESEPGHGSEFIVYIPVSTDAGSAEQEAGV
jgi:signal transduction histidine kinase